MDLNFAETFSGLRREEALTGNSKRNYQEIPRLLRASLRRWPEGLALSSASTESDGGEHTFHSLRFERISAGARERRTLTANSHRKWQEQKVEVRRQRQKAEAPQEGDKV